MWIPHLFEAVIAAGIAAVMANLVVPLVTRMAVFLQAVDHPGGRRHQAAAVPRLGGVAIALGVGLGAGSVAVVEWAQWADAAQRKQILSLMVGTVLVFLVGLIDDLIGVPAGRKLLVQLAAAALLVHSGWKFQSLGLPGLGDLELGPFAGVLSVVFIVGVTNAINLLDGLDGLAGGVVAIISLSFLAYALPRNDLTPVVLTAALAGACLGFLFHNWAPAKVFMGDSGSLTLGFLLAAASVEASMKTTASVAILVPILALGLPVFDTLLVMALRFLRRSDGAVVDRFLHMFRADRNHLHHLLSHVGAGRGTIVAGIYVFVLVCCAAAIVVAHQKDSTLGLLVIGVEFLVILAVRSWGLAAEARRQAEARRAGGGEMEVGGEGGAGTFERKEAKTLP